MFDFDILFKNTLGVCSIMSFNFPSIHSIFLSSFTHVIYFLVIQSLALPSSESLLKMQNFNPHPRPTESESAFLLTIPPFNKIPGDLYAS